MRSRRQQRTHSINEETAALEPKAREGKKLSHIVIDMYFQMLRFLAFSELIEASAYQKKRTHSMNC